MKRIVKLTTLSLLLLPLLTDANEWERSGFVGLESRVFFQDARYPSQHDGANLSVTFQPELRWQHENGRQRVSLIGFARADAKDSERSHLDVREAYWALEKNDWNILIGINKVFWGVSESRHLVDVINQTDGVEDMDGEDKLGQPMINLNMQRDWGAVDFFLLPYFRERTFPGIEGRFRTPLVIDTDKALYESSEQETHVDWSIRYSHYFGDVDLGVYVFDGTSREPQFIPSSNGQALIPVYQQMTQVGFDLQYTYNAWLWKLELVARDMKDDEFAAFVAGYEYSFYQINDSAMDLSVLTELLYDGRSENTPVLFDQDIFLGSRLAFNDSQDSSLLAGVVIDPETEELFFNVEAERRLNDRLSAEFRLRVFHNAELEDVSYSLQRDDYLQLTLKGYF